MLCRSTLLCLAALWALARPAAALDAPALTARPYEAEGRLAIGHAGQSEDEMLRGGMQSIVRLNVSGDKTRVEAYEDAASIQAGQPVGDQAVCAITDPRAGKKYVFVRGDAKARVLPLGKTPDPIVLLAGFADGRTSLLATDAVRDLLCWKYRSVLANGQAVWVWVDQATGLPVKIADGTTFVFVFSKFVYAPQAAALFTPPGG